MKVKSIKISNILSIEAAEVQFEDSGLVLLEGWNHDANRANGAGKTAIFNSLCYGLYGELPRKISISDILRDGTKRGFVEVTVEVGAHIYMVKRERPNKITFFKDGVEEPMTQNSFESKIKLNYEQFLASMYTAQSTTKKFIFKNDTEKKSFLLQLMNLGEFAACRKEAEATIKALDKEVVELNTKLQSANAKIQAYTESLVDPVRLQAEIDNNIAEGQKNLAEIMTLQKVKQPDMSKYNELEDSIKKKQHKFAEIRTKKSMLHLEYKRTLASDTPFREREPDANCPHCDGALNINGTDVVKASDLSAVKQQHQAHSAKIRLEAQEIKKRIDDLDDALSQEDEVEKLIVKLREKKQVEYLDYDRAVRKVGELKTILDKKNSAIAAAELAIKQHNEILQKIAVLGKTVDECSKTIRVKKTEAELYESVSAMCSPTGAPAYVMDSIVDMFNDSVDKYVDMVWPRATYCLNSYKEKSDGDMVAKFSEVLTINGLQKSIGALSGGELRALSLAVDFAILDVLNKQFGMPLNPIIMDEPFEGLDAAGREVVVSLLEKLAINRQIWVVDHASEAKAMFSKVLTIEKRNGISRIV